MIMSVPVCNTCFNDPLYNAPCGGCAPCGDKVGKGNCGCFKCRSKPCCPPPCIPPKDPCPLKSFCDPGLANTCNARPVINPLAPRRAVTTWKVNYLVSNFPNQAAHLDPDLLNPWGIVVYNNQLWVANNGTDSVTNYDLFGNKLLGTLNLRDAAHNSAYPSGIAINCAGGFPISNGTVAKAALFLVCLEDGTVQAFNPAVDSQNAYLVLNRKLAGEQATYKGLAIANNTLYLADFSQGHIDIFDATFNRLLGFHFIDGDTSDPIPLNYGPNNIVHIGCFLYVLWAQRDPIVSIHDLDGPGHGYISVFNLDGSFVRRFTSRGVLNSPWAMIPAPCQCGIPPNSFLVGNNGDGRINIFDCNGRYVGPLLSQSGLPIVMEGLWGLAPHYTDFSEIFFTAGPDEDTDGILGSFVASDIIHF